MALELIDGSVFLHIPKTGGMWVTSILEENGLIRDRSGHQHADYDRSLSPIAFHGPQGLKSVMRQPRKSALRLFEPRRRAGKKPVFRFCFVRHPLSWYESWWKYMQEREWHDWGKQNSAIDWHPNAVLNGLGSDDFNEFVRNVINVRPGYVSELYFSYSKPGISYIGKTEALKEDLSRVLDFLDLDYDRDALFASQKKNVSRADRPAIDWDPELRQLVMQVELPSLLHFGYLSEAERRELGIDQQIVPNTALRSCA